MGGLDGPPKPPDARPAPGNPGRASTPRDAHGSAPALIPFDALHAAGVVDLIRTVFAEYAMTFDLEEFDADLRDVLEHYHARDGVFYVLVDGDRVVGSAAAVPRSDTTVEIKRVYLLSAYRGRGQGRRLLERVLDWAREHGFREAVAWSDVRLETAHQVYDRLGFVRIGERTVEDIDRSREIGFRLGLGAGAPVR